MKLEHKCYEHIIAIKLSSIRCSAVGMSTSAVYCSALPTLQDFNSGQRSLRFGH